MRKNLHNEIVLEFYLAQGSNLSGSKSLFYIVDRFMCARIYPLSSPKRL